MVLCRFYQAGRCKYGNNCRFEHIDPPGGPRGGGGGGGGGAFDRDHDPFNTPTKAGRSTGQRATDDTPEWPLSALAIKDHPEQGNVVEGDVSPEELRLQAYQMAPRGISPEVSNRENQVVSEHQAKLNAATGGGMSSSGNAGPGAPLKDPFAGANPQSGFGGGAGAGFGMGATNGNAPPQQSGPFAQVPQPFGGQTPAGNPFGQNSDFAQPQQAQVQSSAPVATPAQGPQFSAQQFGFGKIPEAAPPPKYC